LKPLNGAPGRRGRDEIMRGLEEAGRTPGSRRADDLQETVGQLQTLILQQGESCDSSGRISVTNHDDARDDV
jgi:hypothetical protein